jgi:hypothetical protein
LGRIDHRGQISDVDLDAVRRAGLTDGEIAEAVDGGFDRSIEHVAPSAV